MAGRKPDYNVHAMDKGTEEKSRIGAAWGNPDGSISIKLNPFIALTSHPDLVIMLFLNDRDSGQDRARGEG